MGDFLKQGLIYKSRGEEFVKKNRAIHNDSYYYDIFAWMC